MLLQIRRRWCEASLDRVFQLHAAWIPFQTPSRSSDASVTCPAGLPGHRSLGGGGPELESLPQTLDQSRASRVPIGIPVFLIDAISPLEVPFATEAIQTLRMSYRADLEAESLEYRKWLDTIPGSRLIVTNRSGHNVAQEQPELVVATIRQVVDEATRRSQR